MTCERPYAFLLLLLIIPAVIIVTAKNKKNGFYSEKNFKIHKNFGSTFRIFNYRRFILIRTILYSAAWTMLVCAFSGIYWGTNLVPVQKNGTSVSFVFDISNSMLANDGPNGMSRLQAASTYADKLLLKMDETSLSTPVSVVLAKGDGLTAIPLTEDYTMIESLLKVMSPSLMTVPGTSLGKGITKAIESFPSHYSSAGRIWVFTDGEETDGHLKNALVESIKAGIPVTIIGFGKESEIQIVAGDGVTTVASALRSGRIKDAIEEAQKATSSYIDQTPVTYINSLEKGSATTLLSQLKSADGQVITYEAKPVAQFKTFIFIAIILFVLAYIIMELDFSRIKLDPKKSATVMVLLISTYLFNGCSNNNMKILKGTYAFHQKQYGTAVSSYLDVVKESSRDQNEKYLSYSLYDLGTAYSMLDENEAALEKFSQISDQAPDAVRYAAFYNSGVISCKNGDFKTAQEYFKKALEVDSSKVDAKINLELSIQLSSADKTQTQQNESQSAPAIEDEAPESELQKAVFMRIKENDENKWKNSQQPQTANFAEDY